jgi:hypothetical protein
MFLILFVVLAVAWSLGRFTFPGAGGLVHLLLMVAVMSLIVHFLRGRAAGTYHMKSRRLWSMCLRG